MVLVKLLPFLSFLSFGISEVIVTPNGCLCSDFTWARRGAFVGDCRALDIDGLRFCYVHQPNDCLDSEHSTRFIGMDVSKIACKCRRNLLGLCIGVRQGGSRDIQSNLALNLDDALKNGFYIDPVTNETVLVLQNGEY